MDRLSLKKKMFGISAFIHGDESFDSVQKQIGHNTCWAHSECLSEKQAIHKAYQPPSAWRLCPNTAAARMFSLGGGCKEKENKDGKRRRGNTWPQKNVSFVKNVQNDRNGCQVDMSQTSDQMMFWFFLPRCIVGRRQAVRAAAALRSTINPSLPPRRALSAVS